MSLLQVSELDVHYGDFQAIYGVGLTVMEGETLAVIGANGAGKSTLLKAIAGLVAPSSGDISFDGVDVTRLPAHKRVPLGIALTPEGRRKPAFLPNGAALVTTNPAYFRKDLPPGAPQLIVVTYAEPQSYYFVDLVDRLKAVEWAWLLEAQGARER